MEATGQKVNVEKYEIYFMNTDEQTKLKICNILGFREGNFHCKYIGISLDTGIRVTKLWESIF